MAQYKFSLETWSALKRLGVAVEASWSFVGSVLEVLGATWLIPRRSINSIWFAGLAECGLCDRHLAKSLEHT